MGQTAINYELYGELLAERTTGAIHVEPIRDRSSKHNWTIRLHRHKNIGQIFMFRSAGVYLSLERVQHTTTQPTFLVVPPGVSHGFRFDEDVSGDVISVRLSEMSESLKTLFSTFRSPTAAVFPKNETERFAELATLVEQLRAAYRRVGPRRDAINETLVELMMLYLTAERVNHVAVVTGRSSNQQSRRDLQIERFCALLEENFASTMSVPEYAKNIGLSAPQLTRICRDALGQSPNALVRQRRLLEAKRLLEYTELTVAEISEICGFNDPAFFSRTFKADVGMTANVYRGSLDR